MSLDISLYVTVDTGAAEPLRMDIDGMNMTHNVTPMWREAGVYAALYESDGTPAGQWLDALRAGVADMEARPAVYEALNPPNGWGRYRHSLPFLRRWLALCEQHPKALVGVCR